MARAAVRFSPGGSGDAASLSVGSRSVGLGWTGGLPAPTLNGAVATYPDVAAGADLELEALPGGFAERLVLRTRPATAPVFRFPLRLTGLVAEVAANGRIALNHPSGRLVAQADPARMWGPSVTPTPTSRPGSGRWRYALPAASASRCWRSSPTRGSWPTQE